MSTGNIEAAQKVKPAERRGRNATELERHEHTTPTERLTLVLGATGKTGRRVLERLRGLAVPTRAASRTGGPPFDWGDQSTWDAVLDGVTAAYISYSPDLDVAVAALTEDGDAGRVYELTGPRLLTFAGAVGEISRATGRVIRYIQIPRQAFAAGIAEAGLPEDIAWLLDYLFATVLDDRNASLGNGVQRALGREPRDFADFCRAAAASGVWNAPS